MNDMNNQNNQFGAQPLQPAAPVQQPMQPTQQSAPVVQPLQTPMALQPATKTNTLCIVALILAFIMGPIGAILGIVGLISSKKKGEKGKGLAIASIIIGIVLPILLVVVVFGIVLGALNGGGEAAVALQEACSLLDSNGNYESNDGYVVCNNYYCEYEKDGFTLSSSCSLLDNDESESDVKDTTPVTSDELKMTNWTLSDNSELKLDASTFAWYQTTDVYTDNYFKGTYKYYVGKHAVKYITTELSSYGVTEPELRDIFARNERYSEDNFVVLVLEFSESYLAGVQKQYVDTVPYYGFMLNNGTYLDIANMNTASYYAFTKRQ